MQLRVKKETIDGTCFELIHFISSLPAGPVETVDWMPYLNPTFEGLVIPSPVNFVGKGANLYELGYKLHGSIAAIGSRWKMGGGR